MNSRSLTSCGETETAHGSPNRCRGLSARGYSPRLSSAAPSQPAEKHTTHIAAADAEGNWVAITATVNTTFGSKVIVPGTGLVLNNQMDDFSIAPGVPNAFGLIGAEANEVAPGKRPLSSMSPTIVAVDGRPVLTCGAAGGPKIITQVVLTIVRAIDLGMPLEQAVASPRFHHQWVPRRLMFEKTVWRRFALGACRPGARRQPTALRRRVAGDRPIDGRWTVHRGRRPPRAGQGRGAVEIADWGLRIAD